MVIAVPVVITIVDVVVVHVHAIVGIAVVAIVAVAAAVECVVEQCRMLTIGSYGGHVDARRVHQYLLLWLEHCRRGLEMAEQI